MFKPTQMAINTITASHDEYRNSEFAELGLLDEDAATEVSDATEVFDAHEFVLRDDRTGQYYRALRRLDRSKSVFPESRTKVVWDNRFRQAVAEDGLPQIDSTMKNAYKDAPVSPVQVPRSDMKKIIENEFADAIPAAQLKRTKSGKIIPPWKNFMQKNKANVRTPGNSRAGSVHSFASSTQQKFSQIFRSANPAQLKSRSMSKLASSDNSSQAKANNTPTGSTFVRTRSSTPASSRASTRIMPPRPSTAAGEILSQVDSMVRMQHAWRATFRAFDPTFTGCLAASHFDRVVKSIDFNLPQQTVAAVASSCRSSNGKAIVVNYIKFLSKIGGIHNSNIKKAGSAAVTRNLLTESGIVTTYSPSKQPESTHIGHSDRSPESALHVLREVFGALDSQNSECLPIEQVSFLLSEWADLLDSISVADMIDSCRINQKSVNVSKLLGHLCVAWGLHAPVDEIGASNGLMRVELPQDPNSVSKAKSVQEHAARQHVQNQHKQSQLLSGHFDSHTRPDTAASQGSRRTASGVVFRPRTSGGSSIAKSRPQSSASHQSQGDAFAQRQAELDRMVASRHSSRSRNSSRPSTAASAMSRSSIADASFRARPRI